MNSYCNAKGFLGPQLGRLAKDQIPKTPVDVIHCEVVQQLGLLGTFLNGYLIAGLDSFYHTYIGVRAVCKDIGLLMDGKPVKERETVRLRFGRVYEILPDN